MDFLSELWLPLVLSAVFVFVASSVIHMLLPVHKGDYGKLPAEEAVLASLRSHGVRPGNYMFPCPGSMKESCTPEMQAKYAAGPVGTLLVLPNGPPAIGRALFQWFLLSLLISAVAAYLARATLGPNADYLAVFQVTGTTAWMAYSFGQLQDSIWKGVKWSTSLKFVVDGLVYALVTGGTFGWLWVQSAT